MSLLLEVEYLSGVSFAGTGPDSAVPEWPPQPDRVFSALVATWGVRGSQEQEAEALEWLEKQLPPRVVAPAAHARTSATVFVPPNDPRSDRQKSARGVFPPLRSRQPRRFPAARLVEPTAQFAWENAAPDQTTLSALQRLAHDTSYVGHSASLTRCRFFVDNGSLGAAAEPSVQRRIYRGRFAELRCDFDAGRRPLRGPVFAATASQVVSPTSVFGRRWLLLEHIDGDMPDLRACAIVAKTIRDALLSGYRQTGLEHEIPEMVSGHAADGKPSRAVHLAIVPLPFAGFPYADGHVMGYALVPPCDGGLLDDTHFLKALRVIAPMADARRILTVKPKEGASHGFRVCFSLTQEPPAGKRSLSPSLYMGPARAFATVTPVLLDRHLKEVGQARESEVRAQIAAACRNIGLPEPTEIVAGKHTVFEGVPSAYPSGRSPEWMRWRLPASLASRQLTHAAIRFAAPVEGPVILGAGRHVGLGFCRPIGVESR